MTPISEKYFFNSLELESFCQEKEDSQSSITEKSSQIAQAVFSSPSHNIEGGTLSHSLDVPDYLLSPSDIQLEDMSYYEQGSFFLEDLSSESTGYKRQRSPREESPVHKRFRLSELEGFQDPISVSNEQEISAFLKPLEGEQPSIPQMDGFDQMVQAAEVLDPSRGEWMRGFSQSPLDSDEEFIQFMQEELFQIEANSRLQESIDGNEQEADEERLPFLETIETDSQILRPQTKNAEEFDEKTMSEQERIVLNAVYQAPFFGQVRLFKKLEQQGEKIPLWAIQDILKKYELNTKEKRIAAEAKRGKMNDSIQKVFARLVCENAELNSDEIADQLKEQDIVISRSSDYGISRTKELSVLEQRREPAKALSREDLILSDPLDLSDSAFSPSSADLSSYTPGFFSLENLNEEMGEESALFESSAAIEQQEKNNETSSHSERLQKKDAEKFDERTIGYKDRIVLNAIYYSHGLDGIVNICKKLVEQGEKIVQSEVQAVFRKFELNSQENRIAAVQTGWPRFNNPPPFRIEPGSERSVAQTDRPGFNSSLSSHIESGSQKSVPFPPKRGKMNDLIIQEALIRLVRENPVLNAEELADRLKEQGVITSKSRVYVILTKVGLGTITKRIAAAEAGWPGYETLPSL